MAAYDILKTGRIVRGMDQPSIEAFFTCNNEAVFAILPRWQTSRFTFEGIAAESVKSVVLLGDNRPLAFQGAADGISVDLPVISGSLLAQPAWVLKFSL